MQHKKTMALFDEIEPPSTQKEGEKKQLEPDYLLNDKRRLAFNAARSFLGLNGKFDLKASISHFFSIVRTVILNNKYLPHAALISLGIVVSLVNVGQKLAAKAYFSDTVAVTPDIERSVARSVDYYTPIIGNDSEAVDKAISASLTSEGFANSTGAVTTEITARVAPLPDNTATTVDYVVENGDTLSGIGMKFDVKIATLKYLNNIDNENVIKPGLKMKVPSKGYEVSASLIAKREKEKQAKLAASQRKTVTRSRATGTGPGTVNYSLGSKANGYPYGYCTYYVATRRYVPRQWGDAKAWLGSAARAGYQTGGTPAVGSIVVTTESWWGHVAFVESVNGNEFTIAEMNARGWGVTSRRTLNVNDRVVRGFIY